MTKKLLNLIPVLFLFTLFLGGCPPLASYATHKTLAESYVKTAPAKCTDVKKLSIRYFFPNCGGGVSVWVSECKKEDTGPYVFLCREKCFPIFESVNK